jgi:hypothetical protein
VRLKREIGEQEDECTVLSLARQSVIHDVEPVGKD